MHSSLHEKFVETYFDVFSLCAIFNVGVGQNGKLDPSSVRYNRVDLGNPTFTHDTDRGNPVMRYVNREFTLGETLRISYVNCVNWNHQCKPCATAVRAGVRAVSRAVGRAMVRAVVRAVVRSVVRSVSRAVVRAVSRAVGRSGQWSGQWSGQ